MSKSNKKTSYIGKTCPFCQSVIKLGVAVHMCEACGIPHHEDCWIENGGCTTLGCKNGNTERGSTVGVYTTLPHEISEHHKKCTHRWRALLVVVALFALLVLGAGLSYILSGALYLRTATNAVDELVGVDNKFTGFIDVGGFTGQQLADAASDAATTAEFIRKRLCQVWSPPRYTPLAHDSLFVIEAHRDFYMSLAEEAKSDEPNSTRVKELANEMALRCCAVNWPADTEQDLSGLPEECIEKCVSALDELAALKSEARAISEYCQSMRSWRRRFDEARHNLAEVLNNIDDRSSISLEEYRAITEAALERKEMLENLESIYAPEPFEDVHECLTDIMRASAIYEECWRREAISRYFWEESSDYRAWASLFGSDIMSRMEEAWTEFGRLEKMHNCDPMEIVLDQ